jgi:hypothetical protein
MRYNAEEHVKLIVAGCTTLQPFLYTIRHNKVAGYVHWTLCKHKGLQGNEKYYEQKYLKMSYVSTVSLLCGTYRSSQIEQY